MVTVTIGAAMILQDLLFCEELEKATRTTAVHIIPTLSDTGVPGTLTERATLLTFFKEKFCIRITKSQKTSHKMGTSNFHEEIEESAMDYEATWRGLKSVSAWRNEVSFSFENHEVVCYEVLPAVSEPKKLVRGAQLKGTDYTVLFRDSHHATRWRQVFITEVAKVRPDLKL